MKMFSLDQAADMCNELFDDIVCPYAYSMMSGELPAVTYMINRTESNDSDWTATVRLKNSLTISVFRCEVYIADILALCRRCKMWLVTEDIFKPTALFYMLHGLLQQQHMDFTHNTDADYESMMVGAGYSTYRFIKEHYDFTSEIEEIALDIIWYHSMIFTNNYKHAPRTIRVGDRIDQLQSDYAAYMNMYHPKAYRTAKKWKASVNQVDEDGFYVLERVTHGSTKYIGKTEGI
jgi:hypothetical protein